MERHQQASSAQTKQCMLSLSSIQVTGLMDSIISRPSEPTNLPIPACKVRVGLRPLRLSGLVPIAECHPLRSLCQKELPRQPVLPHRFDQQNQQTRALALQQVRQCPLTVPARQARRARGATENWRKFRGFFAVWLRVAKHVRPVLIWGAGLVQVSIGFPWVLHVFAAGMCLNKAAKPRQNPTAG